MVLACCRKGSSGAMATQSVMMAVAQAFGRSAQAQPEILCSVVNTVLRWEVRL